MSGAAVEVKDLCVRMGSHMALSGIDFKLPEGAFLAILGPNGSGKTTLIKTLLGLLVPDRGYSKIGKRAPTDVPREWIGYVPQLKTFDRTFPATAVDLVMTGVRCKWPWKISVAEKNEALSLLSAVGIRGIADRPLGGLSGGELQRVYLARALIRDPRIILLDEPAAGVDVVGEADLFVLLERVQKRSLSTICLVTHDFVTAFHHASHVLLLNKNQIGFGRPEEVLTQDLLRRAFGHHAHEHRSWGSANA